MTEQAPTAASAPTTSIARSSAVVAAGTALSRITGLMRVAALAWAMGTGRLADWYNLANLGPNVIYELVLGGVLSAALVPLLTEFRNNDDPESESIVMSTTVVGAGLLTLLALLGARGGEAILTAMTDHVTAVDRARLDTLFSLMALLFPQIFFYALNTMMTARLNAARVFGPAAFTPVFTNVLTTAAAIAAGLVIGGDRRTLAADRFDATAVLLLGLGTTLGVAAMAIPLVRRSAMASGTLRWTLKVRHPAFTKLRRMSTWTLGYVVANQIALVVIMATLKGRAGGVTQYTLAYAFFQLPHGLIAVSVMTTILPELSTAASRDDMDGYRSTFLTGLRMLAVILTPAAFGYVVLAHPVVSILLERGQFGAADASRTGTTLLWFALGLPGFSLYLFAQRAFFARHDTKTPFILGLVQNGSNIALAVILGAVFGFSAPVLAAAYAVSYTVAAVLIMRRLGMAIDGFGAQARSAWQMLTRVGVAALAMALVVFGATRIVGSDHGLGAVARVAVGLIVGVGVYAALCTRLHVEEFRRVSRRLTARISRRP